MNFPSYPEDAAREAFRSLPRLGMDEYMAFLAESMVWADPAKATRQKAVEKQIKVPFRLFHDKVDPEPRTLNPRKQLVFNRCC